MDERPEAAQHGGQTMKQLTRLQLMVMQRPRPWMLERTLPRNPPASAMTIGFLSGQAVEPEGRGVREVISLARDGLRQNEQIRGRR